LTGAGNLATVNSCFTVKVVGRSLQQRVLEPDEVAAMAVYLASDDARGITGQAFNICGGRIFH